MKKQRKIILLLICAMLVGIFSQIPLHDETIHAHAASYSCSECGGSGRKTCPGNGGYTYNAGGVCHQWGCWTCAFTGKIEENDQFPCYNCGGDSPQWRPYEISISCPNQRKCTACWGATPNCSVCKGTRLCQECKGSGTHIVDAACPVCGSTKSGGYIGTTKNCTNCGGAGYVYCFACNLCGACDDSPNHVGHGTIECDCEDDEEITKTYTVTVVASPSSGGSAGGGGTFNEGDTCTVWASPNEGYTASGAGSFKVTGNTTVTVTFSKIPVTPAPTGKPVTPIPYPEKIEIPSLSPTPLPQPAARPFVIAGPIYPPASASPPKTTPISDVHEDLCYVGTKHICSSGSPCYYPVYTHTSSCWGIVGATTCSSCGAKNNCGHYYTCSTCSGSGKVSESCKPCNGSGSIPCNICGGSGKKDAACSCGK